VRGSRRRAFSPGCANGQCVQSWTWRLAHGKTFFLCVEIWWRRRERELARGRCSCDYSAHNAVDTAGFARGAQIVRPLCSLECAQRLRQNTRAAIATQRAPTRHHARTFVAVHLEVVAGEEAGVLLLRGSRHRLRGEVCVCGRVRQKCVSRRSLSSPASRPTPWQSAPTTVNSPRRCLRSTTCRRERALREGASVAVSRRCVCVVALPPLALSLSKISRRVAWF
jgi:hypothetical protein